MNEIRSIAIRRVLAFMVDWLVILAWAGTLFGIVMVAAGGNPGRPAGEPLNNPARSAFLPEKPQIVWCEPSDSSRSYGRGSQRARCGFSGETRTGRAFAGAPPRLDSIIWNDQTALAQAEPEHPAKAPSRPRRVIQRFPNPWIAQAIGFISMTVPVVLYFAVLESSSYKATLGKKALGLAVVGDAGDLTSLGRSLIRSSIKFLPWEFGHIVANQAAFSGDAGVSLWVYGPMAVAFVLPLWWIVSIFSSGRAPYDRASSTHVVRAIACRPNESKVR